MMLKESLHQGHKTILNIYALDNRASKYTKQNMNEIKGESKLIESQ